MRFFVLSVFLFAGISLSVYSQKTHNVIDISKNDFITKVMDYEKNLDKWSYKGKKPCVIYFYADWCVPCRKITPLMEELSVTYKDQVIFYKVDSDKERELSRSLKVSSIPTLIFVPVKGDPKITREAISKSVFESAVYDLLSDK